MRQITSFALALMLTILPGCFDSDDELIGMWTDDHCSNTLCFAQITDSDVWALAVPTSSLAPSATVEAGCAFSFDAETFCIEEHGTTRCFLGDASWAAPFDCLPPSDMPAWPPSMCDHQLVQPDPAPWDSIGCNAEGECFAVSGQARVRVAPLCLIEQL